jgi:hypothetical protein
MQYTLTDPESFRIPVSLTLTKHYAQIEKNKNLIQDLRDFGNPGGLREWMILSFPVP